MEAPVTIRLKLIVHYDGSAFHGWQQQPDQRTVQGDLEAALSRLADRPRTVLGSGRTDTGVHATGQVASVDMTSEWTADKLRRSLNAILQHDLWIEHAERVASDFHPRYDAVARTYTYDVGLRPEAASPFHRRWCWALGADLESRLLDAAAGAIEGEHSFLSFSKAGQAERGERCEVAEAAWSPCALGVRFSVTADRYLHHMVRYLVGTMVDIARGRRPLEDMTRLLDNEGPLTTSPPAPPEGLFLSHVEYPESVLLDRPAQSQPPRSNASV